MRDDTKQAQTIATKLKRLLFNLDLTREYAKSEIEIRRATMKLYKGETAKWKQRRFLEAKIDEERYQIYLEDIENVRIELVENIELILSKHTERYKKIFIMFFLEDKSISEIADESHYSVDTVKKIIQKLKQDLLTFYVP